VQSMMMQVVNSGMKPVQGATGARYIGSMMVQGVADGINASSAADTAAAAMANKVTNITRKLLRINSPSKVFEEIGGYVSEGFAEGVSGSAPSAVRAVGSLVSVPAVSGAGAGSMAGGGATVVVNVSGIVAGTEAGFAKAVTTILRNGVKSGQIPAGYALV